MKKQSEPNYKKIYSDIINLKFPEKKEKLSDYFSISKVWTRLDVLVINRSLFENANNKNNGTVLNRGRHHFYDKSTILNILDYQKANRLNNIQAAKHFQMSRNTIAKWKKIFI